MPRASLNASVSVVLDATGTGRVSLGPQDSAGPAIWHIDGVIVQTTRPGQAPIPTFQAYVDIESPSNAQGLTYDGSFNQGVVRNLDVRRGSRLIGLWLNGQAGDVATLTVTGTKE